ncbi:uncharacterized protein LOC126187686 isoform X1 [Schistocerca cancellata]|uniref:uncharacterized protein LOC126187686 isoform X1 n=1 Tax=Schistocerca cancellata TaxID=274614 RepID=UPI0021180271|nr:uncharacterized protein LOC126187686 isoform X1 [Schistocerca cancellata]
MRATVCSIILTLSSWGFISVTNAQDGRCSVTCRDHPSSTASGRLLTLRLSSTGESLGQLVNDAPGSSAANRMYPTFGGNATESHRNDYPSEAPNSRLFIGRRKHLRVCANYCSNPRTSDERSTSQTNRDELTLTPSSRPANGISRSEPKVLGKSDADSTKKFGIQNAKKFIVAKHGHDKSSRVSHRKI